MSDDLTKSWTFRRHLRQELDLWRRDGLIDPSQADDLTQRYALDSLTREAERRFTHTIFVIGAVLVGIGVTAFVAANWKTIPVSAKIALLYGVMLAAHGIGYFLWKIDGRREHLGHALILLGTLIFGANIGLMGQIYHLESREGAAFGAWALGALAVAWAVSSVPNLVVAMVMSFVWLVQSQEAQPDAWTLWFPVAATAGSLGLSYWKRSMFGYTASLLMIGASSAYVAGLHTEKGVAAMFAGVAVSTAAWALHRFHRLVGRYESVGQVGAGLGVFALCVFAYVLSFHEIAEALYDEAIPTFAAWSYWSVALLLGSMGVVGWMIGRGALKGYDAVFAGTVVVGATLLLSILVVSPDAVSMTIMANVALFGFGAIFLGGGLWRLSRSFFWAGVLALAAQIASRFFEYETGLMLKSAVFIGLGVIVLVAGILFEKRRETRHV
ncbi:MAG: DUF2157 domain-containing protein [Candidatus Poribacteria bacterium]|nr:DUF2157 domain-containing protein [Candidatus Poribacteria bacterium]